MAQYSFRLTNIAIAVPFIIFWNCVVFFLWLLWGSGQENFMTYNFLVSWDSLSQGRVWTLITSVFSHNMFFHFLINMFVLHSFGRIVEKSIGTTNFLRFYLAAGIFSSLAHACVSNYLMGQPALPALGASGSIAGVVLVFSLLYPREKILLLGILPVPALFGAAIFVGLDLWGLSAQVKGHGLPIGHGAHLGGSLAGLVFYLWWLRPRLIQRSSRIIDDVKYTRLD